MARAAPGCAPCSYCPRTQGRGTEEQVKARFGKGRWGRSATRPRARDEARGITARHRTLGNEKRLQRILGEVGDPDDVSVSRRYPAGQADSAWASASAVSCEYEQRKSAE